VSEQHDEEIERKYGVAPRAGEPDLSAVDEVAGSGEPEVHELEAVYFDTPDLDLLRQGVTLRRRVGGSDEGWHLKEPSGPDARSETRVPLGRAVRTVPKRLREAVADRVDTGRLVSVAHLRTVRRERALLDEDGNTIAVLCDDDVRAERLVAPSLRQRWREWEVELTGAERQVLDHIETVLVDAGARRSGVSSKLARALAEELPAPDPSRRAPLDPKRATVQQVLSAYLAEHLEVLREHDEGLRGETVHRLRIAARRLRSALTTYRPVFEPGAVDALRDELRWLGRSLGDARDSEVLRGRLDSMLEDEHEPAARSALRRRLDEDLAEEYRIGHAAALEVVASERFRHLVRSLDAVVEGPALRPRGARRARQVLPDLLERDARRVRRAVTTARHAVDGDEYDHALHEVRKKAKRLRYSAESARPVLGKRVGRLGKRARALQHSLGAHQDTVASRAWLEGLVTRHGEDAPAAFAAGRLHAREEQRARNAERDYRDALDRLPGKHVDRWLRR
jgi:CHAD domain-containing protein